MTTHNNPDKPCDEPTAQDASSEPKASLSTLRGALRHVLPDATYQDFLDVKAVWEPRPLPRDR